MIKLCMLALLLGADKLPAKEEFKTISEVRRGDVLVHVGTAMISQVPLKGFRDDVQLTDEHYLIVLIGIKNSSETKKCDYMGWAADMIEIDRRASMRDQLGNRYRRVTFGISKIPGRHPRGDAIYPGKVFTDLLVFEEPVEKANQLTLTLPAKQIGEKEDLEFHIPVGPRGRAE